jgi:antitoxin ParD1/3/4
MEILAKICQINQSSGMTTMNISLPDPLKNFVDEQVEQRGNSTSSEYVRELIRKDQDRQHLKNLLLEGAASPLTTAMDAEYLEALRGRLRNRKPGVR